MPTTHATIQAAVNAAPAGSHICVMAGTYAKFSVAKTLTIEGVDTATTIVDGGGSGPIVSLQNFTGTVSHFTLTNGN